MTRPVYYFSMRPVCSSYVSWGMSLWRELRIRKSRLSLELVSLAVFWLPRDCARHHLNNLILDKRNSRNFDIGTLFKDKLF